MFKQTEIEADRLSVWLLAGAGYDPAAAARFWSRFGQRKGRPLFQASTHPSWRDRVAALEAEAATIAAARMLGRSEEHTSELQSLMRSSYAVFCLKTKNKTQARTT